MDPDLWELYEDGRSDDEVAAIVKLGHTGVLPQGVRVVTQFGSIVTVRLKRLDILKVSEAVEVVSMTSGDTFFGPDLEAEVSDEAVQPPHLIPGGDDRRPQSETATGRGVVVGVVDWGFDFAHPDFRTADGKSRILALWDQRGGKQASSPSPFGYGRVHDRDALDRALASADPYATLGYHPADADTGQGSHGTHVASIAAGTGGPDRPVGVAPEAELVFVHSAPWSVDEQQKLGDSVTLLEAIDFISRTAGSRPWVVNLSMGRHGEQHDGTTLVEQGLDRAIILEPGRAICMSTGNYYDKRIHAAGQLRPTEERTFIWQVNDGDPTDNELEVWYSWRDKFELQIRSPDASIVARLKIDERAKLTVKGTEIGNAYHRAHETNSLDNQINVFLYKAAPAGAWEITLIGADVVDGRFHAWIERDASCPGCQSYFRLEDAVATSTTGTICNGFRTIAVGAYDKHASDPKMGRFSSVGPTRDGRLKPDLCAPGVSVLAARSAARGTPAGTPELTRMSGTSMAAPYVTGTVALMFQAASRRLRIEETRNLLLEHVHRVAIPGENPDRVGAGFCDIAAAVGGARRIAAASKTLKQVSQKMPHAAQKSVREAAHGSAPEAWMTRQQSHAHPPGETACKACAAMDTRIGDTASDATEGGTGDVVSERHLDTPIEGAAMEIDAHGETMADLDSAPDRSLSDAIEREADREGRELVELADRIVVEARGPGKPSLESQEFLSSLGVRPSVELFETFANPRRARTGSGLDQQFEMLAAPGSIPVAELRPGDLMIRRGDGGFAHAAIIAAPGPWTRDALSNAGMRSEGGAEGQYVHVVEGGAFPHAREDLFARRLTDPNGRLPLDTMVLRRTGPRELGDQLARISRDVAEDDPAHAEQGFLSQLIAGGLIDPVELTDRVFFRRHPELRGRRIGEHEHALRREWKSIHDSLVKQALGGEDALKARAIEAKPVPGMSGWTIGTLVEKHRVQICSEIPLPVLLAFIRYESGGRFEDATHGKAANQYTRPDFYELGLFQVPAGLHGVCTSDAASSCEHEPPGFEEPGNPSPWAKVCRSLQADPRKWTDPELQVRVGLRNLEDTASAVRRKYPTLFPVLGSDWYLRGAVLMPFARGAGYTGKFLQRYQSDLLALPEHQRWGYLSGKPGWTPENVDKKMSLAAKLGYVALGSTAAPSVPGPTTTSGWLSPALWMPLTAPQPSTSKSPPASTSGSPGAAQGDRIVSALATPSRFGLREKGKRRRMPVFGIVVHTTGSGPAEMAQNPSTARKYGCTTAIDCALAVYARNDGFPHYVIDFDGTIYATCPENHEAWHAGWTSKMGGRDHWKHWTPPEWWSRVWGSDKTPLDLIPPGAYSPNTCHLGVELLGTSPVAPFKDAQYESLARLVVDCDRRYALAIDRAPSPKLLGHEDVNPATGEGGRANAKGGWDPGAHRIAGVETYFSWSRLWTLIERHRSSGEMETADVEALFESRSDEGEFLGTPT